MSDLIILEGRPSPPELVHLRVPAAAVQVENQAPDGVMYNVDDTVVPSTAVEYMGTVN